MQQSKISQKCGCGYCTFEFPPTFSLRSKFAANIQCALKAHNELIANYAALIGSYPDVNFILMDKQNFEVTVKDPAARLAVLLPKYNGRHNFFIFYDVNKTDGTLNVGINPYKNGVEIAVPCQINGKLCNSHNKLLKNEVDDMALVLAYEYFESMMMNVYIFSADRYSEWYHRWGDLKRLQIVDGPLRYIQIDFTRTKKTGLVYNPSQKLRQYKHKVCFSYGKSHCPPTRCEVRKLRGEERCADRCNLSKDFHYCRRIGCWWDNPTKSCTPKK